MKNSVGKNIKALREREGLTQVEFGDRIGVTNITVNAWEKKGTQPRKRMLDAICDAFNVSAADLYSETAGIYARLHGIEDVSSEHVQPARPQRAAAPLHGMVHAGNVTELDLIDQSIPIPYEIWEAHQNAFFLQVEGTCMNKVIPEGCHVLIDPDIEPQADSIAVASFNGEYIMRRVHFGSQVILLYPESFDNWEDIVVYDGKVDFIGVVVWWQSSEELS